jgi:hypothetical protein
MTDLFFAGTTDDGRRIEVRRIDDGPELELRVDDGSWVFVGDDHQLALGTKLRERDHLEVTLDGVRTDAWGDEVRG